jgi:hypothetical protein
MESEDLVRRYIEAVAANDFETMKKPGGMPRVELTEVAGAEDHWVVTPSMTIQRIAGSGDVWTVEGTNTYSNGEMYYFVQLLRLNDGTVRHASSYFAAPFEAPAWRAALTVPIGAGRP